MCVCVCVWGGGGLGYHYEIQLYRSKAMLEHEREVIITEEEWKGKTGLVLRTYYR